MDAARRALVAALASLPFALRAQAKPLPRIGFLANTPRQQDLVSRTSSNPGAILIEKGLRDLGWVDGKNVQIVWRSAEGNDERLPALAEELVAMRVDVIVAFGRGVVEAARKTRSIPIVMGAIGAMSEADSLSRPDRNVTGLTLTPGDMLDGKRLALLKEAAPGVKRIGVVNVGARGAANVDFEETARRLNVALNPINVDRADALDEAIGEAVAKGVDALMVVEFPLAHWPEHQRRIHAAAKRHRLPAIYSVMSAAESGGLLAYGADILENYRRTPYFVDRILRGARPADLPIEQPSRYLLFVNRRAARDIDLNLPASLLVRADKTFD